MNRRLALQRVALMVGGAITAPSLAAILNSCKSPADSTSSNFTFATDHKSLVAEIAEVIIPKTDTPGAKDVGVQDIMEVLLKDCYDAAQQKHFLAGLKTVEEESEKLGGSFVSLSEDTKMKILDIMKEKADEEYKQNALEREKAKEVDSETGATKTDHTSINPPTPFFTIMRDLTIFGYYSSEYAINNEYDYSPVPGRYEGCITVDENTKAYS